MEVTWTYKWGGFVNDETLFDLSGYAPWRRMGSKYPARRICKMRPATLITNN
jgi:hypothetical protein